MNKTKSKCTTKKSSAPRTYKDYSEEKLKIAIATVKHRTMSSRNAETAFGIPRRTILNRVKEKHTKPAGGQKKLTDEEEEELAKELRAAADKGSPMTKMDIKEFIFEYLEKNSQLDLFDGKLPSRSWVDGFLDRRCSTMRMRMYSNNKKKRAEKCSE